MFGVTANTVGVEARKQGISKESGLGLQCSRRIVSDTECKELIDRLTALL